MKVKVAHIITDLDIGGAEMMLLKTLRNFKDDRYEHLVISLKRAGKVGDLIKKEGFRIRTLELTKYNFIPAFVRLLSILKKERPQIVHNYLFHAEIFGRLGAKLAGAPIVISSLRNERGYYDSERHLLLRMLLSMTDSCITQFTAVSQRVANVLISEDPAKKDKVKVIYNGLELASYHPKNPASIRQNLNIGENKFLLITIAKLKQKKGHRFLFETLQILKQKGYRFRVLLVGSGKDKKKLEKDVADKGLEDEIIFMGERDDIPELLAASDIFILPSLYEGLPNALLEAMAEGLAAVATRVGGVPEVITDNETGLLVEPENSDALAKAIERMIKEPELRKRLGQNAKEHVRKNFDIRRTVNDTKRLYEELLRKHGKN